MGRNSFPIRSSEYPHGRIDLLVKFPGAESSLNLPLISQGLIGSSPELHEGPNRFPDLRGVELVLVLVQVGKDVRARAMGLKIAEALGERRVLTRNGDALSPTSQVAGELGIKRNRVGILEGLAFATILHRHDPAACEERVEMPLATEAPGFRKELPLILHLIHTEDAPSGMQAVEMPVHGLLDFIKVAGVTGIRQICDELELLLGCQNMVWEKSDTAVLYVDDAISVPMIVGMHRIRKSALKSLKARMLRWLGRTSLPDECSPSLLELLVR